jgi:hypothetical protein
MVAARFALVCCVAGALATRTAAANPICSTSQPIAMPLAEAKLVIDLDDADHDGLDDSAEDELARCATPRYRFDSAENARRPFEPVLLHSVYPRFSSAGYLEVVVHFAELYERDGGYIECDLSADWCDAHAGDSQSRELVLSVIGLRQAVIQTPPFDPDTKSWASFDGTHIILFASAGKHHVYYSPLVCAGEELGACPCQGCAFPHHDRADGAGHTVVPSSWNAGQEEAFDVCALPSETPRGFPNWLGPYGFPGDFVYHPCRAVCDSGGEPCHNEGGGFPFGDVWTAFSGGSSDISSAHAVTVKPAQALPLRLRGLSSGCVYASSGGGPDDDGDGIPNTCDGCPKRADVYQDFPFDDYDHDGTADGCDSCPTLAGPQGDRDGDGVGDVCDNCPFTSNPDQANHDTDPQGDACDPDDDNDGCLDGQDDVPLDPTERAGMVMSATCDPMSAPNMIFAGVDTDGDGQLNCSDDDDDDDGTPDASDMCPISSDRFDNRCLEYHDCPVTPALSTCKGGGCNQLFAHAVVRSNPDPTIFEVLAYVPGRIELALPSKWSATTAAKAVAGARLELWRGGRRLLVFGELSSTPVKLGSLSTVHRALVVSVDADGVSIQGAVR